MDNKPMNKPNIFEICFNDPRIQKVKVKLEKLEVFSEADSVGIEVQRTKDQFKHSNNQKTWLQFYL